MAGEKTQDTARAEARVWPILRRLWRDWLAPRRGRLALNLALIAMVAGATATYPVVIQWALDGFERRSREIIAMAPLVVVAAVLLKSGALYAHRMLTNSVLAEIEADMQRAMYATLVRADLARLDREAPAATASRFTVDVSYVRSALESLITSLVRDGLTVVGLLASLLWIDWELTLYALAALPIAAAPIAAIGRRLRRIARRSQQEAGQMTARVNEGLGGIRLAKTYRLEDYLTRRAGESFETLRKLKVKAADQRARIDPALEALAGIGLAVVFYVIGMRIAEGRNTIGDFMAFVSAFLIAGQPLRAFGNLYAQVLQGAAAAERIYELLDARPTIADRPGAEPLPRARGEIRFENVGFVYEDGSRALSEVNLTVPAGARVALVGRSGAGKSTIFNLIPRLYDATEGRVLIDGRDVRDVTLDSLRDQIAVVSQEPVIFDDTVARNIAFGRPGASMDEIRAAARAANAADFIEALPEGYETMAGPRGGRFSGGERQRLTIARAILRDAPILLLDEATSALDAESEALVRAALDRLAAGRTTFVIAHRLSTVRDADLIVALDRGRVVEQGRHEELIARGGLYAELHRLQFNED
ncbi:ABC transporter ATP-binding protein [Oceanicella actignis]|uniref:ATP-binding cassette, subfamily B, MsbA n=1 Tax=Oceanicella actignis TaxID=1189325 RepID=A0A1M7TY43_9RHOB|nr:ABC transporter ATP-binding protein [Oceanicella actignis]SET81364.1 ATP-binding cassette, subfamily B, MsbA [Oceanicella actignis]SHN75631.1 ATP-binding cassette, subfamily B, MsbA [Oceanicella actignis]